jgi:OHCU decarboxylase
MEYTAFVEKFGGVYEHFPEVAIRTFGNGLSAATDTPKGLAATMAKVAGALDRPAKLKLIRNHPDLAGRLGVAELTEASRSEQAGAGLDQCTPEEFARFQELNRAYKEKFEFPFILAVAGKTRRDILAAFETRIGNDRDTEFRTALAEIDRIARIRLEAMAN